MPGGGTSGASTRRPRGRHLEYIPEPARRVGGRLARSGARQRAYLSRLEAGIQKNPSIAVLKRLAKALGVPVAALLE